MPPEDDRAEALLALRDAQLALRAILALFDPRGVDPNALQLAGARLVSALQCHAGCAGEVGARERELFAELARLNSLASGTIEQELLRSQEQFERVRSARGVLRSLDLADRPQGTGAWCNLQA